MNFESRVKSAKELTQTKGFQEAMEYLGWSIPMFSAIDEMTSGRVVDSLLVLNAVNPEKQITIIVNSPGGYVSDTFAIIDAMNYISNPVRTIAMGQVSSGGLLVFMAGDERYISPNASVLSHRFWTMAGGSQAELEAQVVEWKNIHKRMVEHYIEYTNLKTAEEVEEKLLKTTDTWLTPKQVIKFGLADGMLDEGVEMVAPVVVEDGEGAGTKAEAIKVEAVKPIVGVDLGIPATVSTLSEVLPIVEDKVPADAPVVETPKPIEEIGEAKIGEVKIEVEVFTDKAMEKLAELEQRCEVLRKGIGLIEIQVEEVEQKKEALPPEPKPITEDKVKSLIQEIQAGRRDDLIKRIEKAVLKKKGAVLR